MLTAGCRLLTEQFDAVMTGAVLVRNALSARRLWLVIDRHEADLVSHCRSAAP